MIRVLSLGAGVQSTCLLLQSVKGELPKLDAAVFADTGWEGQETYDLMERLKKIGEAAGIPVVTAQKGNIRRDMVRSAKGGKTARSMPFYTKDAGPLMRQCTQHYKIAAVDEMIRKSLLGLAKGQRAPMDAVELWIGISADELKRITHSRDHWKRLVYPLVQDISKPGFEWRVPMFSRDSCVEWLRRHYPFMAVPKSACIGCPYKSDAAWLDLKKNHPEQWEDAVAFDKANRNRKGANSECFLHSSRVPLDQVEFRVPKEKTKEWDIFHASFSCGVCGT